VIRGNLTDRERGGGRRKSPQNRHRRGNGRCRTESQARGVEVMGGGLAGDNEIGKEKWRIKRGHRA